MPFAFPINPDSAIKSAGGAGREAAAGTGPLGAVASAPLPFRPRLLPAPRRAAGRPGRGREPRSFSPWNPDWRVGAARLGRGPGARVALPPPSLQGELWAPRLRPLLTNVIKRRGAGRAFRQAAALLSCLGRRLTSDPLTGWRRTRAGPEVFWQLWSRQTEAFPMYLASCWLEGELGLGLRGNACRW